MKSIYTYGDLNTDGFTYAENSNGTIWFADANDTVQLTRKINPCRIRWNETSGWTVGKIELWQLTAN